MQVAARGTGVSKGLSSNTWRLSQTHRGLALLGHAHAVEVGLEQAVAVRLQRVADVDRDAARDVGAGVPRVDLRACMQRHMRLRMQPHTALHGYAGHECAGRRKVSVLWMGEPAHLIVALLAVDGLAVLARRQLQASRA